MVSKIDRTVNFIEGQIVNRFFPADDQVITADCNRAPARAYSGLGTGPSWNRLYETQSGLPVDGSNKTLRDPRFGSPFTFRVLTPDILTDAILEGRKKGSGINIIDSVNRTDSTFSAYRRRLESLKSKDAVFQNEQSFNLNDNYISEGRLLTPKNLGDPKTVRPMIADVRKAADVLLQFNKMLNTPPLTMLINPQSLVVNHQKVQNYSDRGRFGYIFQSWGEELTRLTVSGKLGAFIAGNSRSRSFVEYGPRVGQVIGTETPTGVQWASRKNSASWQNFMNLYLFYKNNGYIFDNVSKSEAHQWIGTIAIDYDQWTYVGNFQSFEFGFNSEQQNGGTDFNFEFVASKVYDNASFRRQYVAPIQSPVPSPNNEMWRDSRTLQQLRRTRSYGNEQVSAVKPAPTVTLGPLVQPRAPTGLVRGGQI